MLRKITLFLTTILLLVNFSIAKDKVFSVTVKRIMGEHESRDDISEIAALEATREALEQAGTYIETETIVRDFQMERDEIIALTAGVTSTKIANEKWAMEGGHFAIILNFEVIIDTTDVEDRIKALRKDRQKLDEYKSLQKQNAHL